MTALGLLLLLVLAVGCSAVERIGQPWWEMRRDSSGQAPDPAGTPDAVVQVYAARTVGWKGVMAVHTWIAVKPSGAGAYTRYEVMGWGVGSGTPALRVNRTGPDNYWFGSRPDLLSDRRGAGVDALITRIEAAIQAYPYPSSYRTWPGPNSNTFTAYVGRAVPELRLDLPATAIGKDFIPGGVPMAWTPSGTGVQVSLLGLLGVLAGGEEGLELNVLGLTFGLDVKRPALKLPVVGRLGWSQRPEPPVPEQAASVPSRASRSE
ncbi:MAG TPA: DUF3750 domain-containing protein [Methylomirabilota bacterium]|nr:DUF3750 domain-containing protein [Methylomirabilota bacterium]